MSETRHTPGPWAVVDELDIISSGQSPIDGTFVVGVDVATCGTSIVEFYEIAKANARLIAAAPELLEQLKSILSCFKMTQLLMSDSKDRALTREIAKNAEEVIAKAEGR